MENWKALRINCGRLSVAGTALLLGLSRTALVPAQGSINPAVRSALIEGYKLIFNTKGTKALDKPSARAPQPPASTNAGACPG